VAVSAEAKALAPAAAAASAAKTAPTVNLNTATESELEELPGVGPSKAAAIVAFRKQRGGFRKVEDLMKVKGIGRKTFMKLRPYLAVSGPGLSRRTETAAVESP